MYIVLYISLPSYMTLGMHTSSYFTIFAVCIVYSVQFYALMQPIILFITA